MLSNIFADEIELGFSFRIYNISFFCIADKRRLCVFRKLIAIDKTRVVLLGILNALLLSWKFRPVCFYMISYATKTLIN